MTQRAFPLFAVLGIAALAGCAGPSLAPVPSQAASPYICDGVPQDGADLLLGGQASVVRAEGTWGTNAASETLRCGLENGDASLRIKEVPVELTLWGMTDAEVLASIKSWGGTPIAADSPGEGYMSAIGAAWVCDGRVLWVDTSRVDVEGRDLAQDAANLLISMLPWACGDEEPPPASTSTS